MGCAEGSEPEDLTPREQCTGAFECVSANCADEIENAFTDGNAYDECIHACQDDWEVDADVLPPLQSTAAGHGVIFAVSCGSPGLCNSNAALMCQDLD